MLNAKTIALPTILSLFFASLFFIPTADARGRGKGMGPDGDGPGPRMMERLNLNDGQKEQVKALRESNKEAGQALRDTIEQARDNLHTLMQSDASEDDLRAAHAKVQEAMQAGGNARFEQMLKLRAILTPEQREEMGKFKDERGGRRGKRSGGRGNF